MLDITVDQKFLKDIKKQLDVIQRKQIPFALSNTLNELAFEGRKVEQKAQLRYLDKPNRFTTNGYLVNKSNKHTLIAQVYVPANRWSYLKYVVEGGASTRGTKQHSIAIDKDLLNRYGSLPRNKARSLANKKGHFLNKSKGNNYLFKREGKSRYPIKPLIIFKETTQHSKRYPLWRHTIKMVEKRFNKVFTNKMEYAIRTMK